MTGARPEMPLGIEDRNADVWEPLFAVADGASGDWPSRARAAAVALLGAAQDAEPSLGIRLLADMKAVFEASDKSTLATASIIEELIDLHESPWGDLKGKPINERTLARRLRQYGIKSKVVRIRERTLRGYSKEDFHDAWLRYCARSDAAEAQQAQQAQMAVENVHISRENVAGAKDAKRNSVIAKRNAVDVAENVESSITGERNRSSSTKPSDAEDVADVALMRGEAADDDLDIPDGLGRAPAGTTCAECHEGEDCGVLKRGRADGRLEWRHRECWYIRQRRASRPRQSTPPDCSWARRPSDNGLA